MQYRMMSFLEALTTELPQVEQEIWSKLLKDIQIVNIILDYLKNIVQNLLTITIFLQGVLWKKYSETLNKILEKYLRHCSFLVKLQVLKMNSFTCPFQGFC